LPKVSYVATFGCSSEAVECQESPHYRVVGWKMQNDRGRVVRCSPDDAEYAVLMVDGDRQEVAVSSLFFCPKSSFCGEVSR